MKKWLCLSSKWSIALMLALVLLLLPFMSAGAAEEEASIDESAPAVQESETSPIWDDLSYCQFLLRNNAFYPLNDKVLKATNMEDLVTELIKADPWAQYYPAETFTAFMDYIVGDFVGIGVYLREEEGQVTIAGIMANSPSEKAGLKNGDIIVEIDGTNTRNASMEELQELLSGEENTLLTLKYERDGKATTLTMSRKRIVQPSMEYWFVEDSIAYVRIDNFTTHTGQELADGVKSLKKQGMTALIVDLRNCPGGELEGAIEVSGVLAGEGPMLFFVDSQGWQGFAPIDEAEKLGLPLAVLINGDTASSAELVAANVQDAKTGVLIGETSFGKGVIQSVITLPSGAGISFTTSKYTSHGYQDVDAQGGVLPDIYITGEEAQRDKAIDWLKVQLQNPTFLKYYANSSGYSRGGVWQNTPAKVVLDGGVAYIPLLLTLNQLGWQTEERDGLTYVENNGQRLIVDAANNSLINSAGSHTLLSYEGQLYMPATLLRSFGYTVTWDNSERSVKVEK